jgi:hypothetical protein
MKRSDWEGGTWEKTKREFCRTPGRREDITVRVMSSRCRREDITVTTETEHKKGILSYTHAMTIFFPVLLKNHYICGNEMILSWKRIRDLP